MAWSSRRLSIGLHKPLKLRSGPTFRELTVVIYFWRDLRLAYRASRAAFCSMASAAVRSAVLRSVSLCASSAARPASTSFAASASFLNSVSLGFGQLLCAALFRAHFLGGFHVRPLCLTFCEIGVVDRRFGAGSGKLLLARLGCLSNSVSESRFSKSVHSNSVFGVRLLPD